MRSSRASSKEELADARFEAFLGVRDDFVHDLVPRAGVVLDAVEGLLKVELHPVRALHRGQLQVGARLDFEPGADQLTADDLRERRGDNRRRIVVGVVAGAARREGGRQSCDEEHTDEHPQRMPAAVVGWRS